MVKPIWKYSCIISVILLIIFIFTWKTTSNELDSSKLLLTNLNTQLLSVTNEFNNAKSDFNSQLSKSKNTIADLLNTISTTSLSLSESKIKIGNYETQVNSLNNNLSLAREQLNNANNNVSRYEDILNALSISLHDTLSLSSVNDNETVIPIDNPNAHNPTWEELSSFLLNDHTEQHAYISDIYDCTNYAHELHNNAEHNGIKCAIVTIFFSNSRYYGHELNAFVTTDYGLIYIDLSGGIDCQSRVEADLSYIAHDINYNSSRPMTYWGDSDDYYYIKSDYYQQYTGWIKAVTNKINIYW